MKNIRKNILKLFLFVCFGLAVATIAFASTRNPIDPPDRPGTPMVIDKNKNGCTIEYTKPKKDGGSPITGYIIEYRDGFWSRWEIKGISTTLRYTAVDLIEGHKYSFRVKAVNAAGPSEPSEPSDYETIKDR